MMITKEKLENDIRIMSLKVTKMDNRLSKYDGLVAKRDALRTELRKFKMMYDAFIGVV